MVKVKKYGRLGENEQRKLGEILGIIEQEGVYVLTRMPLTCSDLSRKVGDYYELKDRKGIEVAHIKIHYEGDKKRTAVIHDADDKRIRYNHNFAKLIDFLEKDDFEIEHRMSQRNRHPHKRGG